MIYLADFVISFILNLGNTGHCPWHKAITHWGRNKMAAVSQMTFSNVFHWMKMHEFWLRFISVEFVPKGMIRNIPALVQIMAWHRPGDKPLSEAMMVRLPIDICVIRPQWVNVNSVIWIAKWYECCHINVNNVIWISKLYECYLCQFELCNMKWSDLNVMVLM